MDFETVIDKLAKQLRVGAQNPELAQASLSLCSQLFSDFTDLFEQYDEQGVSDYNHLQSLYTTRELKINGLTEKLNSLEGAHRDLESETESIYLTKTELELQVKALEKQVISLKKTCNANAGLRAELNHLKSLDPEGMKHKLHSVSNELKALKKKTKSQSKIVVPKEKEMQIPKAIESAVIDAELKRIVDGEGEGITLTTEKQVNYSFIGYNYRRTFSSESSLELLNDLHWHYHISSSLGISLSAPCTEWATPLIPPCTELEQNWHPDIFSTLHSIYMERLKPTHPQIVARVEWAKKRKLATLPISESDKAELLSNGIKTVFDFYTTSTAERNRNQPGSVKIPSELVSRVRTVTDKAVSLWQGEFNKKPSKTVAKKRAA